MKFATEMASGCHAIHTKFHKDWFQTSEVDTGGHTDGIRLLSVVANKESKLIEIFIGRLVFKFISKHLYPTESPFATYDRMFHYGPLIT
jgi:hypothetical protein